MTLDAGYDLLRFHSLAVAPEWRCRSLLGCSGKEAVHQRSEVPHASIATRFELRRALILKPDIEQLD